MKITVREEDESKPSGPIPLKINYLSGELEIITVRTLQKTISKIIPVKFLDSDDDRNETGTKPEGDSKMVEIKISLQTPDLRKAYLALKERLLASKKLILRHKRAVAALVLVLAVAFYFVFVKSPAAPDVSSVSTPASTRQLPHGTPDYSTILPSGKTAAQLGGWTRVSPPGKSAVYAYVDKVNAVQVDVSEQPLPGNLQTGTGVEQLAQNFGNTEKLTVNGVIVYLGAGTQGSQSAIFSKDNLLVLIKAASPLSNDQWARYVNSLE